MEEEDRIYRVEVYRRKSVHGIEYQYLSLADAKAAYQRQKRSFDVLAVYIYRWDADGLTILDEWHAP